MNIIVMFLNMFLTLSNIAYRNKGFTTNSHFTTNSQEIMALYTIMVNAGSHNLPYLTRYYHITGIL